jgi:hypothetical protein
MSDYIVLLAWTGNRASGGSQLTSITKLCSLCIRTARQHSKHARRHAKDPTVLEANDSTALVLQNTSDIETGMLAGRIRADEIRPVDEDSVDFDRVTGVGSYEAIF